MSILLFYGTFYQLFILLDIKPIPLTVQPNFGSRTSKSGIRNEFSSRELRNSTLGFERVKASSGLTQPPKYCLCTLSKSAF